jgi:hypothetical protein
MRLLLAVWVLAAPAFQDIDAKKERIGAIFKEVAQAKKEAGGDKAKEAECCGSSPPRGRNFASSCKKPPVLIRRSRPHFSRS